MNFKLFQNAIHIINTKLLRASAFCLSVSICCVVLHPEEQGLLSPDGRRLSQIGDHSDHRHDSRGRTLSPQLFQHRRCSL